MEQLNIAKLLNLGEITIKQSLATHEAEQVFDRGTKLKIQIDGDTPTNTVWVAVIGALGELGEQYLVRFDDLRNALEDENLADSDNSDTSHEAHV